MGAHSGEVHAASFSADGEHLVSGGEDGTIRLWNCRSGKELAAWENRLPRYYRSYPVYAVAFSPSGRAVISGGNDYAIKVWDGRSGEIVKAFGQHYNVVSLGSSANGQRLVSGSRDCMNADASVKLWDVASGAEIRTFDGDYSDINAVALSPDGSLVAAGSDDAAARIWSAKRWSLRRTKVLGCRAVVQSVAFSPDGRLLATGDNAWQVRIWNVATGAERPMSGRHDDSVRSVCFSGDGQSVASAGWDSTVRVWNVSSGEQRRVFRAKASLLTVTFSPDSRQVWAVDEASTPHVYRFDL
ncbi:MAG TPA: WD40 repeat domain-containing protein [Thermoanaerobaculia bacterium]